jgi:DHA3 family tetracycline resistance protein-like MFS transporter
MVVGAVCFAQSNPRRRRGLLSYLIWLANSLLVILFALSPWYPLSVVASFLRGGCIGFGIACWETMLMELVPRNMLSRVVSLDWFGSLGLTPFGLLLVGAVSGLAPPGTLIALGALVAVVLILFGLTRREIRSVQ